ncbi:quinon protein alcohol dehydrogenase-like superfamily [Xylariaceae sp. FL1019]|nr:quinon protein alcohol dehydrogenase-like superfamily [Xylariaceae sp. FL1019]
MPDNHNCHNFVRFWAWLKRDGKLRNIDLTPHNASSVSLHDKTRIEYADLQGDSCDLQGINWRQMGVTRTLARKCRVKTFHNYVNITRSDAWNHNLPDTLLNPVESYYQFRSMDIRRDVRLLHFQLRHILGCASRTRIFYPTEKSIKELDPTTGRQRTAMTFDNYSDSFTSTLAAEQGILIAGSFYGTYHYRHLDVENGSGQQTTGRLTDHPSGITNHVQISPSRHSSVPLAAFASNDCGYRIVDLATNQIISRKIYPWALNCSSLSPDKRLRVMVGDTQDVIISDAENGQILQSLDGHRDFGFACDWSPDGWHVATGNQDRTIRIWDARKWSEPVAVLRTEMTGVRSLRFSPLGSGKRLLAAAEEADFINIIDAETFDSKQTIGIFGELAGISFASDGEELIGLSSDPDRGGILSLELRIDGERKRVSKRKRKRKRERIAGCGYQSRIVERSGGSNSRGRRRITARHVLHVFFASAMSALWSSYP